MTDLYKQAVIELTEHNTADVFQDCVRSRIGDIKSNMTFENQYLQEYINNLCRYNNIKDICKVITNVLDVNKRTECLMVMLFKNTLEDNNG